MEISVERVAELEWANYAATLPSARVTPGLNVVLRQDIIMTSSRAFPAPDTNHACLLRAPPQTVDALIAELTDYFRSRDVPIAVYVSPACEPDDLPTRLRNSGFERLADEEAWLVLENLPTFSIPAQRSGIFVECITAAEAAPFAEVFMAAFGMPPDLAPAMAQLIKPSVGLATVDHYLAMSDGQPVGTCSMLRHGPFGVLGSTGVLPDHRRSGAATNLAARALRDAREQGVETVMLQTGAGTPLESFLVHSGFTRAFTRQCYTLSYDPSG